MFFWDATAGPRSARVAFPKQANKEAKIDEHRDTWRRVATVAKLWRGETSMTTENTPLDPNRLTVEQAARVLSAAGSRQISVDLLRQDLDAGAPTNPDGTINLVHYAAWLVGEMGRGN